jgi:hypothetical protein
MGTRGEPVGQLHEAEASPAGLALGPLVAVDPHLGRIREVGADLDEPGTELAVKHVEVVDPDPALLLGPPEVDATGGRPGVLGRGEHPLELLGGDDGDHPVTAGPFGSLQIGADVIELAVIPAAAVGLLQQQDRDPMMPGEGLDLPPEAGTDALDESGRADAIAEVAFQEVVDLRPDLQVGHVGLEVQTVDALQFQSDVAVEYIVDVHHIAHRSPRSRHQPRHGS